MRQHLLLFLFLLSTVGHAQIHKMERKDSAKVDRTYNLNPVVVTGSGHHQRLKSTATPVHVLSSQEIREQGISTFDGALTRMMPQVSMAPNSMGSQLRLNGLGNKYILMMFLGIFFYCGAEASMFNRIPSILIENNPGITPALGNIVLIIALFVGRFFGGVCLRHIKPAVFLVLTILVSIIGNVLLFLPYNAFTTWLSFILIGIGFANIFPLIFSISVDKMPEKTNEIAGLMTTAIVGAAIVPLLTGAAANVAPKYAFFVTLACLLYLGFVALKNRDTVKA